MKLSTPREWHLLQIEPSSFVGDPELIRMLEKHSAPVACNEDRALFRQDEPSAGLYILHQGQVTLSVVTQGGQSLFAAQALPGSLLGLPGLVSGHPYTLSASARAGAQISFLSREDFMQLMMSHPDLSVKVLRVLAAEVRSARRSLD